jgi:hypothetical protein
MAYDSPCYFAINHRSNPAITYNGATTGVTGSEDNHLTLNMTAQIDMHWNDTSLNEEGFRIERSPDSLPHAPIRCSSTFPSF